MVMFPSGFQVWRWMFFAYFHWLCVCQDMQEKPRPCYLVTIPENMKAGLKTKVVASLLHPTLMQETLHMTISLIDDGQSTILFQKSSDQDFHLGFQFQAPQVQEKKVVKFKVEVRGETFLSSEERKITILPFRKMTFVEMDKPVYHPGQIVHFRIISLDINFTPLNELYSVELEDVNGNRIGQWLNTTSRGNILQLSHPLNSEAPEGKYTITFWIDGERHYRNFQVQQYVLPKIQIECYLGNWISAGQEEYKVKVCAKYTDGQPVMGKAEVELCRPMGGLFSEISQKHCHKETVEMDQTGCVSHVFNLSTFLDESKKMFSDVFVFNTKVVEQGTGITRDEKMHIQLFYSIGRLSFLDTPRTFKPGSIVEGKIKAVHFNDTPISNMSVYLLKWSSEHLPNLTTDIHGIASFSLNTTEMPQEYLHLRVSSKPDLIYEGDRVPYIVSGQHSLSAMRPAAPQRIKSSYLEIQGIDKTLACGQDVSITVRYKFEFKTVPVGSVDVIYLALSRRAIVDHGYRKVIVQDSSVTEGEVTLDLGVVPEMVRTLQILVYSMLPSGTVIAHSMNFPTEKCFRNKVSVEFSPSNAVPGEKNTLQLSALPGSLCGLSVVDKRLKAGQILDYDSAALYVGPDLSDCVPMHPSRYMQPYLETDRDKITAYSVFKDLELEMATNLDDRVPSCIIYKGKLYEKSGNTQSIKKFWFTVEQNYNRPTETVHKFFPETWIWDLVEVGESGSADVSLTVPDTITNWTTEAFCLAPGGFGLAPPVELNVFQPFFLEITLPYCIIQGENFDLKATVFNYLSKCIMVAVTPAPSLDYTLTPLNDIQYSSCLCANERKTFSWTMSPSVLGVLNVTISAEAVQSHAACDNEIVSVPERGRVDIVTRSLLVKAEGTEETETYNWLLCPSGEALTEEVKLQLPMIVVKGSARASLSVLGDILGRALKNLDGLLRMPYGCGEQNMALLAPNIYILEYLRNTEQLTSAIRDKATKFLTSGYQRQLNYKHSDGAYSTFGRGSGNTWLTAFVFKIFSKARSFIYIDYPKNMETMTWLQKKQKENGCFMKLGELFNNRIKGGVTDEVTLTAYITASMLELNMSVSDPVVNSSLSCLRNSTSDLSNTYTTALLAYTFTLAGDMEMRTLLLQHLDKMALQKGGLLHWTQTSSETSASLAVEISSYVLLASLSASPLSTADLGYSSRIVRWLVKQQNSYGGFSSTQDTVVALQALSLYSTKVFSKEGSSTVTVKSPSGGQHVFDVNQNNKLLYQERQLQEDVVGKYTVEVKGSACASVQLSLHYNIPTPKVGTSLSIQVIPEVECNSDTKRKVKLYLQFQYGGKEQSSNMIIVDVKMLSGFSPVPESLKEVKDSLLVERVDNKDDHVLLYLTGLQSAVPQNCSLDIIQKFPVKNLKSAVVKIYDYYQPSDQAETEYVFPCAVDTSRK
ncbi:alpha-2-macroglobulin [Esox lucius]|uniref:alpha-2-macroglobulin n=1 Tax=Esox lucius TaxID=8010 RepID=UPI0014772A11|nr:alpha-2-macroglobulin [Esox lucius]